MATQTLPTTNPPTHSAQIHLMGVTADMVSVGIFEGTGCAFIVVNDGPAHVGPRVCLSFDGATPVESLNRAAIVVARMQTEIHDMLAALNAEVES